MILVLVLLYTKVGVDATFHTVGQEKAGKDEENLQHCTNHYLDKPARLRYLSKSTKITTNIETAMMHQSPVLLSTPTNQLLQKQEVH